jgi:cyclophilin family peptidyl-prolyl cis-trans isomerase
MKNILISIITGVLTVSCEKQPKAEVKPVESIAQIEEAVITTQYGDMVVNFFDQAAPMHVESFKAHANSGYYNGTIFHRVIPGFVIQGGDPNTKGDDKSKYGMGGYAGKYFDVGVEDDMTTWNIPAEFNDIKHRLGILSMARSQSPNSGGSQFFICAGDVPNLDGQYTVFGQVIEGQEIIDQIVNLPRDGRDNPNQRIEMQVRLEKRNK